MFILCIKILCYTSYNKNYFILFLFYYFINYFILQERVNKKLYLWYGVVIEWNWWRKLPSNSGKNVLTIFKVIQRNLTRNLFKTNNKLALKNRANTKMKSFKYNIFGIFCFDVAHNNWKTIVVLFIFYPETRLTRILNHGQMKVGMVGYFPEVKYIVSSFTSSGNKGWNCFGDQWNWIKIMFEIPTVETWWRKWNIHK